MDAPTEAAFVELDMKLSNYFDELTVIINERDRLLLDAAWGATEGVMRTMAFVSALGFGGMVFVVGAPWWASFLTGVVVYLYESWRVPRRLRRPRDDDRKQFAAAAIPEWKGARL